MKTLKILNASFNASILTFILLIPNQSDGANTFKLILFFATIALCIVIASFYSMFSFNKAFTGIKKYLYFDIAIMLIGIFVTLQIGHEVYKKTANIWIIVALFVATFLSSLFFQHKIKAILTSHDFNLMQEIAKFFKMGHALEVTPLWKPLNKLDNYLLVYAIAVGISTGDAHFSLYFVAAVAAVVMILSVKSLQVIKGEFLKSGLVTAKEVKLSIFGYYLGYLLSIGWMYLFPNLTVIIIAGACMVGIKLYAHRIAIKTYEEENKYSSEDEMQG